MIDAASVKERRPIIESDRTFVVDGRRSCDAVGGGSLSTPRRPVLPIGCDGTAGGTRGGGGLRTIKEAWTDVAMPDL